MVSKKRCSASSHRRTGGFVNIIKFKKLKDVNRRCVYSNICKDCEKSERDSKHDSKHDCEANKLHKVVANLLREKKESMNTQQFKMLLHHLHYEIKLNRCR